MGGIKGLLGAGVLGVLLAAWPAQAADDASAAKDVPAPAGEAARPAGTLDFSLRARMLAPIEDPRGPNPLGLESATAPTGAGTSRMPSAVTELRPGLYVSVTPVCIPGEDGVLPPLRGRGSLLRR